MKLKRPWYFMVLIILILLSVVVYYRGQDIKQLVFGIFKVEFWPKQSPQTQSPKDLPEQKNRNTTTEINQHTEGPGSHNIYVGSGAKSEITLDKPGDKKNGEK